MRPVGWVGPGSQLSSKGWRPQGRAECAEVDLRVGGQDQGWWAEGDSGPKSSPAFLSLPPCLPAPDRRTELFSKVRDPIRRGGGGEVLGGRRGPGPQPLPPRASRGWGRTGPARTATARGPCAPWRTHGPARGSPWPSDALTRLGDCSPSLSWSLLCSEREAAGQMTWAGRALRPSLSSVPKDRWMPRPLRSDENFLPCCDPLFATNLPASGAPASQRLPLPGRLRRGAAKSVPY